MRVLYKERETHPNVMFEQLEELSRQGGALHLLLLLLVPRASCMPSDTVLKHFRFVVFIHTWKY